MIIGYSPLTDRVYLGNVAKNNPNQWVGNKTDITNNFIQVLLQKFEPGTESVIAIDGKNKYKVTVTEITEEE